MSESPRTVDWPVVGNDPGAMRYSELDQINTDNVAKLQPAWTYHTGELEGRPGKTIECTPIVIDGEAQVARTAHRSSSTTRISTAVNPRWRGLERMAISPPG